MGPVAVPKNLIELSSAEDHEEESEERDINNSQEIDTSQPEAIMTSPQKKPKDIKWEEQKTPPLTKPGPRYGSAVKHNTTVTRHNTRPIRSVSHLSSWETGCLRA